MRTSTVYSVPRVSVSDRDREFERLATLGFALAPRLGMPYVRGVVVRVYYPYSYLQPNGTALRHERSRTESGVGVLSFVESVVGWAKHRLYIGSKSARLCPPRESPEPPESPAEASGGRGRADQEKRLAK